jgi:hypothetical protein
MRLHVPSMLSHGHVHGTKALGCRYNTRHVVLPPSLTLADLLTMRDGKATARGGSTWSPIAHTKRQMFG